MKGSKPQHIDDRRRLGDTSTYITARVRECPAVTVEREMKNDRWTTFRSLEDIEKRALEARALLEIEDNVVVCPLELISCRMKLMDPEFRYEVCSDFDMPGDDARTLKNPIGVKLPERTQRRLRLGDLRAKFTIGHELGHIFLHPEQELSRPSIVIAKSEIPPGNSTERQANVFAGAFYMPRHIVRTANTPDELAKLVEVSADAAETRMRQLGLWPKHREIPPYIQAIIDEIKSNAGKR